MANVDRPFGARVSQTGNGGPHTARVTRYPAEGELYQGAFVKFDGGSVVQADSGDTFVGVVVAIGGTTDSHLEHEAHGDIGAFNPDNLTNEGSGKLESGEEGYAWVADDPSTIFEIQAADGFSGADIGSNADITNEDEGNDLAGRSEVEIDSGTNNDVIIVGYPRRPDNDTSEENAEWFVRIDPDSHQYA